EDTARRVEEARAKGGPFRGIGDLALRARVPRHELVRLALSGALHGLGASRRGGLWGGQALGALGGGGPFFGGPLGRAGGAPAADERGGPGVHGLRLGGAVAGEAPAGAAPARAVQAAGGDRQGAGAGPARADRRGGRDGDLPAAAPDRQGVLLHLAGGRD